MNRPPSFSVKTMLARLVSPYWSPYHPTKYSLNCEGEYGPGVEFKTNAQFRLAWNIFWAMSYKLHTPKQIAKMNMVSMQKVIVAAIAISRIKVVVESTEFSLAELSMLMEHKEFVHLLANEVDQLRPAEAGLELIALQPQTLLSVLCRRFENPSDERKSQ